MRTLSDVFESVFDVDSEDIYKDKIIANQFRINEFKNGKFFISSIFDNQKAIPQIDQWNCEDFIELGRLGDLVFDEPVKMVFERKVSADWKNTTLIAHSFISMYANKDVTFKNFNLICDFTPAHGVGGLKIQVPSRWTFDHCSIQSDTIEIQKYNFDWSYFPDLKNTVISSDEVLLTKTGFTFSLDDIGVKDKNDIGSKINIPKMKCKKVSIRVLDKGWTKDVVIS